MKMTDYVKRFQNIRNDLKKQGYNDRELERLTIEKFAEYCYKKAIYDQKKREEVVLYTDNPIWKEYQSNLNNACDILNISFGDLCTKSRKRELVMVRHCIMYYLRERTKHSLITIGHLFGGRDHSTVLHGIETHENLYGFDVLFTKVSDIVGAHIKTNIQVEFNGEGHA